MHNSMDTMAIWWILLYQIMVNLKEPNYLKAYNNMKASWSKWCWFMVYHVACSIGATFIYKYHIAVLGNTLPTWPLFSYIGHHLLLVFKDPHNIVSTTYTCRMIHLQRYQRFSPRVLPYIILDNVHFTT